MNKYPNYTDTGIEWIGKIPSGWKCIKLKYITNPKRELSEDGTETLLSVTEENGIVPRSQIRSNEDHLSRSDDLKGYLKVQKGDLVNNIMLVWKRGLGVSKHDGIVSPAYSIFAFKENMNSGYFHYLLRSDEYIAEFKRNSTGIVDSRLRLYDDSFGRVFSHVPPLQKQTLISKYLDKKTSQIDSLIEKIQQKIELLKEQRTSLINQCVTKGLNPDVEMKDSGVEWIGEIPNNWKVKKLKHVSNMETGTTPSTSNESFYDNIGTLWIKPDDLSEFKPITSTNQRLTTYGVQNSRPLPPNSVLVCGIGSIGKFGFSENTVCTNQQINGVSFDKKEVVDRYGLYLISSLKSEFQRVSEKVVVSILNKTRQKNVEIPVPSPQEQVLISIYLDKKTSQIDYLIEKEAKRIELLKEYRQSLISNVVTGKMRITEEMI